MAIRPGDPIPADQALDFIAEMLRTLGEHAFAVGSKGVEEIEAFFEAWARHLLIGIPPPGREKPNSRNGQEEGPRPRNKTRSTWTSPRISGPSRVGGQLRHEIARRFPQRNLGLHQRPSPIADR